MNIKNKDGKISAYGFACGYVEAKDNGVVFNTDDSKSVELYRDCGVYHIRAFNWSLREIDNLDWNASNGFRIWYSVGSLSEARKIFKQECKKLGL